MNTSSQYFDARRDLGWYAMRDTSQLESEKVWRDKWERVLLQVRKRRAKDVDKMSTGTGKKL